MVQVESNSTQEWAVEHQKVFIPRICGLFTAWNRQTYNSRYKQIKTIILMLDQVHYSYLMKRNSQWAKGGKEPSLGEATREKPTALFILKGRKLSPKIGIKERCPFSFTIRLLLSLFNAVLRNKRHLIEKVVQNFSIHRCQDCVEKHKKVSK